MTLSIIFATLACLAASGSMPPADGKLVVLEVREASNPDGKLLTMEESQLSSSLYPKRGRLPREASEPRYCLRDGAIMDGETVIARNEGTTIVGTSVSRNEFGIRGGLFPSPSGDKLAYYYKDEAKVGTFPLLDITTRTGTLKSIRYPMIGMASEKVGLMIYDNKSGETIEIHADDFDDERYLTLVSWRNDDEILVGVLDRSQHNLNLNIYDASTGQYIKTLLEEHDERWVEPYDAPIFLSDNVFLYSSDCRDGYKNMYLVDMDGNVRRLVMTDADLNFAAFKAGYVYYTSAEVSPAEKHLFRVKLSVGADVAKTRVGKPERLTSERGWHNISFGEECYLDSFSSFGDPGWTKTYSFDGKLIETLAENACDPLADYAMPEVEFGTVASADGLYENHYRLYKPLGFDPSKKYPVVVYVYGGPHTQLVRNSWMGGARMWEVLMAQRGYVVYVQDNRGTPNHGAEYEKSINRQCGVAEMEDQIAGLRALMENEWVDRERIGVHGWSYGGFMTISLATTYPEIFKVAVAGGPVIDWRWYEIMYGERYMDNPGTNPEGFERTSLINKAENLEAKLLICQGAIDDTVVWEHSLSFVQKCIDLGKQINFFPFPKGYHNMYGNERVYLYQKITDYFENNL